MKSKMDSIWIGYVGRLAKEKGVEHLIDAISLLIKKGMQIRLVFAGPYGDQVSGEENYFTSIRSLLEERKIPYSLNGRLKKDELGAFYRTLDCLVLPSVNKTEAFGMVQVEAMLAGTPVVASDLPGVKIPVALTQMGLLVPPKNSILLADALYTVIQNPKAFTSQEKQEKTKSIFSIKKVLSFYDSLI